MFFRAYRDPDCVFIRVRKTGSTSIVRGLLSEDNCLGASRDFPEQPAGAFCFAFVRHPLERLLSAHAMFATYKVETEDEARLRDALTLDAVMDVVLDDRVSAATRGYRENLKLHALPMSDPAYRMDRADMIGRFETFDQDYRRIAERLGFPDPEAAPHLRRPPEPRLRPVLAPGTLRRIGDVYARDFDQFGYDL